jgi:hypothetical protein
LTAFIERCDFQPAAKLLPALLVPVRALRERSMVPSTTLASVRPAEAKKVLMCDLRGDERNAHPEIACVGARRQRERDSYPDSEANPKWGWGRAKIGGVERVRGCAKQFQDVPEKILQRRIG